MLEPLGPQKHSIFIKRVIKFKLVAIFASDAAWGLKNHLKTGYATRPSTPKRCPRAAQERSGASQESPKSLPKPPLGRSAGTLRRPKGVLGWFWEPRAFISESAGLLFPTYAYFS